MIDELRREQIEKTQKRKKEKRKRRCIVFFSFLAVLIGISIWLVKDSGKLETTHYQLTSEKVKETLRFAVLSDLHSREFGDGNSELIERIQAEEPDLVFMIGDMVNKDDTDIEIIRKLCKELMKTTPVYYSLGNHEGSMMYDRLDSIAIHEMLSSDGVNVLLNHYNSIEVNGTPLCIAGIVSSEKDYDLYSAEGMKDFWKETGYKVLLSHYPTLYYEKLKDADMDLALAGHFHGGVVQIPGLGGLYHPEGGLFPKYSGGQYELSEGTLIVSRGMGGKTIIPRINNRPELVVIEVKTEGR